jgi:hypothetical protein
MATEPPVINALPAPPDPNDRSTFNARAYPWSVAQQTLATEANAVAANVYANAQDAAAQAQLATTNGAAQVALATTQAQLATTNGAAQVELATTQVALAAAQAQLATTRAGEAGASASAAVTSATYALASQAAAATSAADSEASRIAASKLNLGNKAAAPTLDNQGAALLAGATYYDTAINKWRVWTGSAWGDGISAIAGVASVNGMTGNVSLPPTPIYVYDNRASLRGQTPAAGEMALVDGLGLFVWESGSTEPDDDESCFATTAGRWLLQAVHWDVVDAWQLPDDEARDAFDEDEPLRFSSKVLTGSAACAVTSVTAGASISFAGSVTGAAVGDRVIATPPSQLGATAAETGRLGYHAWVSAANTVTIMLTNASASSANTNAAIQKAWPITVIKS